MQALVVYESMFGNTERIARAIAEGLPGAEARIEPAPRVPEQVPSRPRQAPTSPPVTVP